MEITIELTSIEAKKINLKLSKNQFLGKSQTQIEEIIKKNVKNAICQNLVNYRYQIHTDYVEKSFEYKNLNEEDRKKINEEVLTLRRTGHSLSKIVEITNLSIYYVRKICGKAS